VAEPEAELKALVARVTSAVAARAGKRAGGDLGAIIAAEVAAALERPAPGAASRGNGREALQRVEVCASCAEEARRKSGKRAVVTTTGKNAKGIVARIAQAIADTGGDILDISQTLVSDYFTMIIIVDTRGLEVPFAEFKARLERTVGALGAACLVMHEDVVDALQRI
jgi:ACT domain-containing protein